MKLITTIIFKKAKFSYLVSTFLILLISLNVTAHQVDAYHASCNAGPQYVVTATVSSVNASSNYRWQWKSSTGVWNCFVNGANTINGNSYNVSGAVFNLTTTPGSLVFTNPNSGLQGLEIRMVISDGSGVNPCTLPAGNTWTNAAGVANHFINVTGTACASCTGRVTSLYFNELAGGADLPITNGSTFTIAQLASLYNLEAATTGTVGSVKFTITGPTATSNIENTAPYNSPGTGSGAWTGAVGTYSVNIKTYNAADAGGTQCHDTTITFHLTNTIFDCNCTGTNVVLNPGFESGISNWSFSGGTLSQGNGAAACGSFSGDLNNTSATSKAWQTIGTNLATGTVVNVSVYAGVHDNSFNNFVAVEFLNASNVVLGTSVYVQVDKVLANAPVGPQLYTFTATVPTGTTTTRVAFGGNGTWTKTDRWCVTLTAPATGSIGDFVWNDGNGNGLQDATEPGLSGVQVQLLNTAGTVIATTTTNGVGFYQFTGLVAGTYTVKFLAVPGFGVSPANVGANDAIDSDVDGTGSVTVVLAAGQSNQTIDAGFCPTTLCIGNLVWNDANNNGIKDASEVGISGATVNIYQDANNDNIADAAAFATTTTSATGAYSFCNLVPGNYIIGVVTPAGFAKSTINGGDPDNNVDNDNNGINNIGSEVRGLSLTLAGGAEPDGTGSTTSNTNNTYDFGFYPILMSLGDRVFADVNNNGVRDASEVGIVGLTVNLYLDANNDNIADGAAIATTTTNATGNYLFSNLNPGNYIVGVTPAAGFISSTNAAVDPDNNIDADDNGTNLVGSEWRGLAITLAPGTEFDGTNSNTNTNITYDFGFFQPASIGDFVFNDINANGIQDAGELGISGVTVTLTFPDLTTATTTTNASGLYSFTNLGAGTYSVSFTTPAGFTPTGSNVGANDAVDSDPISGVVTGIVLTAGQVNNTIDAGFYQANLNLGNNVWYDQNNDGIKQATETGIVGATVNLYADANNDNVADAAAIATTTTIAGGAYGFANLAPGNYIVGVIIPTGYAVVTTNGGDPDNDTDNDNNGTNTSVAGEVRSSAVTLSTGGEPATAVDGDGTNGNLTVDFGFKGTASIGDFVFNDTNGNGIQDGGELGIPNATVTLTYPNGATVTTTTNASGIYSFTNLAPGTYSVAFNTPAGFTPTASNVGANDAVDSDPISGVVTGIVLTAGQVNNTIDAGFYQANLNLGNNVWYDQNNDGIKQATETGIVGATVNLYADANNDNVADGAAIATTTTIAGGAYGFANLAPGNYIVGVIIPTGYAVVTTNGGDPDNNTDNDNNGTNISVVGEVRSSAVTLTTGGEPAIAVDGDGTNGNLTVDFGFKGTASIGDFVFNDTNGNGIQDGGELGIPNATVTLTYPNGSTTTTTTNASGIYSFTNLAPGTYSVAFTTPAGFANASPANQGANDAVDSDPVSGVVTGIVLTAGQINNTVDAGFYNCVAITSGINGPTTICAAEAALFTATGAGSGSVYTWTFMSGTPATATGSSVTSSWSTPGEYDITLTVTKNGCTQSYTRSIIITQSVFAGAGPDADICSGSSTTLNGSGPAGSNYSWTVVAGDPTSIDNGASQQNVLVSPLVTTTYLLTVTQNGCTRTDQVTVFINVNKNPIADAGPNRTTLIGTPVAIGGSPTGTAPLATPGAALGYIWSPATGLNSNTLSNPTATLTVPGVYNYQVIVYSILTGCSDTAVMSITAIQPVNLGNHVWYDKNNNGIKEVGEPGVATTVKLYKDDNNDNVADGAAIATTTTVNGVYNFGNLYPGNYIVSAVIPNGFLAVNTNGGDPDNNVDNDNNGINTTVVGEVRTSSITLSAGGEPAIGADGDDNNGNLTLDIALTGLAQLGNFVWEDVNRNGIQDATEAGIPNVTVTITYPDGGTAISTTNGSGAYLFDKLMPGTYSVAFTTPNGFFPTTSNVTGGSATDANDSDPVNGIVSNITLSAGQNNSTIDAGFFKPINIYGNIWHDANALADNQVNKTSLIDIPVGLNIYLVDDATGLIVRSEGIEPDGTYAFLDVAINKSYRIVLSSIVRNVGQTAPGATLPSGWRNTGENLGAGPGSGSDGINDGILYIDTESSDIFNANFGIRIKNGEVIIG